MNSESFSPEQEQLIHQLRTMPRPKIDASIREAIQQEMLREFRSLEKIPVQKHRRPTQTTRLVTAFAALVAIGIIGFGLLSLTTQTAENAVTTAPLSPSAQVVIVPSATASPDALETIPASITHTPTTPTATAAEPQISETPDAAPDAQIVIEGPITHISDHTISIYSFSVEVAPQHPIFNLVNIGDVIRIEGELEANGTVTATVIDNILSDEPGTSNATVNLEGPIEAIEGNIITVNSIQVQIDHNNPILQSLQVGNFVTIQGNFEQSGTQIILVTVNITIVNNTVIEGTPVCWYHEDGMGMGHWHCDGMGMGMGMGDAMGMGMGR